MKKTLFLFLSLIAMSWSVHAEEFQNGVHYTTLPVAQPTVTGDKIEVLEVFWYGCPHCFKFEPFIERWQRSMPANAQFVAMPGVLRPSWEPHGRAFYTAQLLGVQEKIHKPLFNAIHLEKRALENQEQLAKFFAEFGVDEATFNKTYTSFAVETRVRQAKNLVSRYGLDGVPTVIVNGKYIVSNRLTGGPAETLKVIDHLVAKESKK